MTTYNTEHLKNLKDAYASGVLKVRNGDDWIEYNSMRDLRVAIADIESEIANSNKGGRPLGTHLVTIRRG